MTASIPQRPCIPRTRRFASARSVLALMLREMSTRYGRTPGGYLWAVLEPLGAILVMSFVFALFLRTPPLGNSFILFYATGFLPFVIYAQIQGQVQSAISFSKPLLFYPAVTWIDAIIARLVLNLLTGVVVMVLILSGLLMVTQNHALLDVVPMVTSVMLAALLGLGLGVLNCCLVGLFPAYGQLWGIATRPLFLLAGVIFIYETLPPSIQSIVGFTPWIHLTGLFRHGVYPTYQPDYISLPIVLIWAMGPLALGLVLLRRYHLDILNR